MKDVAISAVSTRTKGPARTGIDCEAVLRITSPNDLPERYVTTIRFNYIVVQKTNGTFEIDMY